jgi:hypothetical protein
LRTCEREDLESKLNPVTVMFLSNNEENEEILGYNREETLEHALIREEAVNRLKTEEDSYVNAVICDGMLSTVRRRTYVPIPI